ncbi:MAG: hypothetical protein ACI4TH_01345, partial [Candidatus Ornithomonoglobus sp.]
ERWVGNVRADEQNRIANERNAANDAYQHVLDSQEIARNNIDLRYYPDLMAEELRGAREENDQAEIENAIQNAKDRGFFISADESALPWLSDYRSGSGGYTITPWLAQAKQEYDVQHSRYSAQYKAKAGV